MIHVRTSISPSGEPTVHLSFSGVQQISQLESVINKAINCQPEFDQDWFKLVDGLHSFLARATAPAQPEL